MHTRTLPWLALALFALLTPLPRASAQDAASAEDETEPALAPALAIDREPPRHDDPYLRFEGTMGFVGAYARYASVGLRGEPMLPRGAFDGGPLDGVAMAGLRYDVRLVVSCVRMTVGGDLGWGMFDASGSRTVDVGGSPTTLAERSLFDGALRFGLGLEASVEGVRLFADLLGVIHFVELGIETQGVASTLHATVFTPALRAGVRIPVTDGFFVQLSADGSPFAPSAIGGDLSVGGAFE